MVFYLNLLEVPGAPPGDKQYVCVVQELSKNWNTHLMGKGNAVKQSTKLGPV